MVVSLKKEEMLTLAEKAVRLAQQRGADEVEAFVYEGLTSRVNIQLGQISKSSRIIDIGLGIRAIAGKAVGFSYTNMLKREAAVEETVLNAVGSAKASKPDKDWQGLPAPKSMPNVKDTYDKRIMELDSEELVTTGSIMLDSSQKFDSRAFPIDGGVGASYLSKAVANSSGVNAFDSGTILECSLATIAREGKEATPVCFEFNVERKYDVDPEWIGKEAARLAVSALKARKTETKNTNVIFTQFALQQLLHFTLINAVKADYVQRDQSALKNKLGETVASDSVTIYDDGLLDGGIRTWRFDDEGVPQQNTPIIENGVLHNFIYDEYTARRQEKESTGNASRAGYRSTPSVEPTNFHVVPGDISPDRLVSELKEGLLVSYLQGAHSSNPASGEYSVVAAPAWKIENGEIAYATKGTMLAGDVFQMLTNVSTLANNERKVGELVTPWVLVENIKVIGK